MRRVRSHPPPHRPQMSSFSLVNDFENTIYLLRFLKLTLSFCRVMSDLEDS